MGVKNSKNYSERNIYAPSTQGWGILLWNVAGNGLTPKISRIVIEREILNNRRHCPMCHKTLTNNNTNIAYIVSPDLGGLADIHNLYRLCSECHDPYSRSHPLLLLASRGQTLQLHDLIKQFKENGCDYNLQEIDITTFADKHLKYISSLPPYNQELTPIDNLLVLSRYVYKYHHGSRDITL